MTKYGNLCVKKKDLKGYKVNHLCDTPPRIQQTPEKEIPSSSPFLKFEFVD